MEFQVTLEPMIGERKTKHGLMPVHHAFDKVFIAGQEVADAFNVPKVCVGYSLHQSNTLPLLEHAVGLSKADKAKIAAEVSRLTGRAITIAEPPRRSVVTRPQGQLDLDRPAATTPMLDLDA